MKNESAPLVRKRLALAVIAFSLLCMVGYCLRRDYYHKQSDQFFYLSIADSLRQMGTMLYQAEFPATLPTTATAGAALLMYPLSAFSMDTVYISLSCFYFLLHISTLFPLAKLLAHFGLGRREREWALAIYFCSFPIVAWKIWPVNEGPSLALVSWWLYFVFVRKSFLGALLCAFLAPIFRIHILLYELSALIYALALRRKDTAYLTIPSLIASFASLGLYRLLFPYNQQPLGGPLKSGLYGQILVDTGKAATHLLVPETITQKIFAGSLAPATALIGGIFLCLVAWAIGHNLKNKVARELQWLGISTIAVFTVSLACSTLIIARFYSGAYLWMVVALVAWIHQAKPGWLKVFGGAWLAVNAAVLFLFLFSASTDPDYQILEDARALSAKAPSLSPIFLAPGVPMHPRQVYGYWRRPSAVDRGQAKPAEFLYLARSEEKIELPHCLKTVSATGGTLQVLQFRCP